MPRVVIDAIHDDQLREHGGLSGLRDENLLESALARPHQQWHYAPTDLVALAAAHAFGIMRSHPYRDGNQRVAFLALVTFLELNGQSFDATDAEVVTAMLASASDRTSETHLTEWIRRRTTSRRR